MTELISNNFKNVSISYILFKLHCKYYFYDFYENKVNLWSKFRLLNKLAQKKLMIIYLLIKSILCLRIIKKTYTKKLKGKNYISSEKFLFNNKYI